MGGTLNYSRIGRLFGKRIAKKVKKKLSYAGLKIDEYNWIGFEIVFSSLLAITVLTIISAFVSVELGVIASAVTLIITILFLEISLDLLIDVRGRFVEEILPDVLNILSINLRGGLSIEDSLILAAKYEFGFFSKNLALAAKELHTGKSFSDAIKRLNYNIKSDVLDRVIYLILESSASGGELADVLDKISRSIIRVHNLNKEVQSSTLMYIWYVVLIAGAIAPLLFSVVFFLYQMMSTLTPQVTFSTKIQPHLIDLDVIRNFLIVDLIIVGFSSGILLGVIKKGNMKYGIKYIPILIAIALIVFFVAHAIFQMTFGAKVLGNV